MRSNRSGASGPAADAAAEASGTSALTALEMAESNSNMMRPLREQTSDVRRDDQILIGVHDADRDPAARLRNAGAVRGIGLRGDVDPEVFEPGADAGADRRRVFTNTAGEHDRVQPVQCRCERRQVLARDMAVQVDGLACW